MAQATATTDHDTIRRWVEARKGHPAVVKATEQRRGRSGLLRIDFEPSEESLGAISWDEFFQIFERNQLAFVYQDKTDSGRKSRFNKFVSRDSVHVADAGSRRRAVGNGSVRADYIGDEHELAGEGGASASNSDDEDEIADDYEEDEEANRRN